MANLPEKKLIYTVRMNIIVYSPFYWINFREEVDEIISSVSIEGGRRVGRRWDGLFGLPVF